MSHDRLSVWAKGISPSPTLAVDAKAKALKAEGKDVCGFGAGEPDFDTPDFIKEACVEALRAGQTKYCPAAGLPALKKALADQRNLEGGRKAAAAERTPANKFSDEEREAILAVCHQVEYQSLPPAQIVPRLADNGEYVASESSFYRVLREAG